MIRTLTLLTLALAAPAADPLQPLDIRHVKVSGEIGRRIDVTIHNNLLVLDADKDFLAPLDKQDPPGGYIGLGKLLMSAVRFAAYSGHPKVAALKDHLVSRILAAQSPDGYIGFFSPPRRVTVLWDVHETGYLIAGLTDNFTLFHHQPSLAAAVKAANFVLAHWAEIPPDWGRRTGVATHVAVTGIERTMLHLHQATGDRRYLDFVTATRGLPQWDLPVIVGRRDGIEGHIYAFMARSLAQLELFRLQPDPRLLRQSSRALDFFTRSDGMAVTGGAGQWEIWTDDQNGRGQLAETCATAYQLRLLDSLLRLHSDPRMGDLMERTIHNTLFAAQSPGGRHIRYYSPLEGPREYHPGDTYCCPGNYRRIVSELPEMIYYRTTQGLAVNLYTASQASIDLAGVPVTLRQETTYPSSGAVTIEIDPARPASFELQLRIPAWAKGATLSINGQPAAAPQPGSFAKVTRLWKSGDRAQLNLPMDFRLVRGRQRQAGRVAVLRGPVVFSLNPSADPSLAALDSADLTSFTLDPASLQLSADDSLRPGGLACLAGAWRPGYATQPKHDLRLRLTEFADPNARATYFRLRDMAPAVDDELLAAALPAQTHPTLSFETQAGSLKLTAIRHASFMLEAGGQVVHVDPTGAGYDALPKADLVLITDIHGDHLDPKALGAARKPGAPVVAPEAAAPKIESPKVMRNGESTSVGPWRIEAIPMYNLKRGPKEGAVYHEKGRGNGYIVTYGGFRLYIAGDTEGIAEMRALKNIDAALVCMNLPYTMTPEEAADAVKAFHPKVAIPYHYRGADLNAFSAALAGTGVTVKLLDWYH